MSDPLIKTVELEIDGRHYIFSAPLNHPLWSYEPKELFAHLKELRERLRQSQPPSQFVSDVSIIKP